MNLSAFDRRKEKLQVHQYSLLPPSSQRSFLETRKAFLRPRFTESPRISLSAPVPVSGVFSGNKNGSASIPRISLHCEASRHKDSTPARSMRRVSSEPDTILSETAGSGGNADRREVGAYYKEMLKSDPSNSLILANYGRFLHQVLSHIELLSSLSSNTVRTVSLP